MKLRLTGGELRAAAEGLTELGALALPAGVAFRIVRLTRELRGPLEDLETTEMRVVERYMERDAEGTPIPGTDAEGNPQPGTVRLVDAEAFGREMQDLLDTRVEMDLAPVAFAELEAADVRIAPRTLLALGPLLRE